MLNSASSSSESDLPAYVSTTTGGFAAHPSTIINQNRGLLEQIEREKKEGSNKFEEWEQAIRDRELQERRRKAPGWLDREERILEPAKKQDDIAAKSLMDEPEEKSDVLTAQKKARDVDALGEAMDRAFGTSEMG